MLLNQYMENSLLSNTEWIGQLLLDITFLKYCTLCDMACIEGKQEANEGQVDQEKDLEDSQ